MDIYLYGMIVLSTMHLLDGDYPAPDGYREISESHRLPGGETGNAAVILAKLGHKVKIDGPHLGVGTRDAVTAFYAERGIDASGMVYDPDFAGLEDLVLVDTRSRTVFGRFAHYFADKEKRWSEPDEIAIRAARIVSIDPFFGRSSVRAAELCQAAGKAYITIDCPPGGDLHQGAAATVIAREYAEGGFPGRDPRDLLAEYTAAGPGLVVMTRGSGEIVYGRRGGSTGGVVPYKVKVRSTLGAGDVFRAGIVHGVLNDWEDERTVRFAAAVAALCCARFPMALDPPEEGEILRLMINE